MPGEPWSEVEVLRLQRLLREHAAASPSERWEVIARTLGRSVSAVKLRAARLQRRALTRPRIVRNGVVGWRADEQDRLLQLLQQYPPTRPMRRRWHAIAAQLPSRSPAQVRNKVHKLMAKGELGVEAPLPPVPASRTPALVTHASVSVRAGVQPLQPQPRANMTRVDLCAPWHPAAADTAAGTASGTAADVQLWQAEWSRKELARAGRALAYAVRGDRRRAAHCSGGARSRVNVGELVHVMRRIARRVPPDPMCYEAVVARAPRNKDGCDGDDSDNAPIAPVDVVSNPRLGVRAKQVSHTLFHLSRLNRRTYQPPVVVVPQESVDSLTRAVRHFLTPIISASALFAQQRQRNRNRFHASVPVTEDDVGAGLMHAHTFPSNPIISRRRRRLRDQGLYEASQLQVDDDDDDHDDDNDDDDA